LLYTAEDTPPMAWHKQIGLFLQHTRRLAN
jgi:hypothetical protein